MNKLIQNILNSFNTSTGGFSARKLSAFAGVVTGIYITVHEIPKEFLIEALYAWLAFALLCLGIITVEQVLRFKNGSNEQSGSQANQS